MYKETAVNKEIFICRKESGRVIEEQGGVVMEITNERSPNHRMVGLVEYTKSPRTKFIQKKPYPKITSLKYLCQANYFTSRKILKLQ